ncbi:hypothetical protein Pint_03351 [Pistacia integerrima]|uniref:Uncharacterized protein n=1 Tax=Pistacia integerrima TaxID=434235 RepID=A0ACC0ZI76_9ROSI|nr:hypothetical protein Pint_03351 [Pistacia integerrima]
MYDGKTDTRTQDCLNLCLPGVPDSLNELLYALLLQARVCMLINHDCEIWKINYQGANWKHLLSFQDQLRDSGNFDTILEEVFSSELLMCSIPGLSALLKLKIHAPHEQEKVLTLDELIAPNPPTLGIYWVNGLATQIVSN